MSVKNVCLKCNNPSELLYDHKYNFKCIFCGYVFDLVDMLFLDIRYIDHG